MFSSAAISYMESGQTADVADSRVLSVIASSGDDTSREETGENESLYFTANVLLYAHSFYINRGSRNSRSAY